MVLTDLPFAQPDGMTNRYSLLKQGRGPATGVDQESGPENESQKYAAFLKEKERRCGPDGYVDSIRFQHSFQVRQSKDASKSAPSPSKNGSTTTVVDLTGRKEKDQKDYERRLKVVEDHMWQHKQEERELKRVEGDIVKNQRAVRRTLRDYENAIARKRLQETKKLNQSMDKYTVETNNQIHKKEEITKNRIENNIQNGQAEKDMGRKLQLTTSHLARKYRSKMDELELKRKQMERISQDFESKLRSKEEEQFKLKQELADMAIQLNMEVLKGKQQESDFQNSRKKNGQKTLKDNRKEEVQLETKLSKSEGDVKQAEASRRKLSADLAHTRAHLSIKQREEGRHRQDTENRLRNNISEQKQLNEAALHAELDMKAKQLDQKMAVHDSKRVVIATKALKERKERGMSHESHFSEKFKKRYLDQQRREHEDGLKFFQKMVGKGEERENNLYTKVRNSEYARQKQEQSVKRLQAKLNEVRAQNQVKIKNEMKELTLAEKDLEQKLIREQAALAKVHAEREESYVVLQRHREALKEDKYLLEEHTREHQRLMRVGARSQPIASNGI